MTYLDGNILQSITNAGNPNLITSQTQPLIDAAQGTMASIWNSVTTGQALTEAQKNSFLDMMKSGGFIIAGATVLIVILSLSKRKRK
jgi:hypothetical protein